MSAEIMKKQSQSRLKTAARQSKSAADTSDSFLTSEIKNWLWMQFAI